MKRLASPQHLRAWAMDRANIPAWLFEECIAATGNVSAAIALVVPSDEPGIDMSDDEMLLAIAAVQSEPLAIRKAFVVDHWRRLRTERRMVFTRMCMGVLQPRTQLAPPEHAWTVSTTAVLVRCVLLHAHMADRAIEAFTLGVWHGEELVPLVRMQRAEHPEIDDMMLDAFVIEHTIERVGPVRAVAPSLVIEIAIEAVRDAPRRKCGMIVRSATYIRTIDDAHPGHASTLDEIRRAFM